MKKKCENKLSSREFWTHSLEHFSTNFPEQMTAVIGQYLFKKNIQYRTGYALRVKIGARN